MEELTEFARSILGKSHALEQEGEKLFQDFYNDLKDSFSSIDFTRDTPQKHKRAKAGQVLSQQQTSSVEEKDLDADSDVSATGRPLRNRTTKMRESFVYPAKVKKEPKEKPVRAKRGKANDADKRKTSVVDQQQSSRDSSKKVKLDDSVELIKRQSVIIELSDEEVDKEIEKMPPPSMPAPKASRKPRTKKQSSVASNSSGLSDVDMSSVKVKEEPVEQKRSTRSKAPKKPPAKKAAPKEPTPPPTSSPEKEDPTFGKLVPKTRKSSIESLAPLSSQSSVATTEPPSSQEQPEEPTASQEEPKKTRGRTKKKVPDVKAVPAVEPKVIVQKPVRSEKVSQDSVYEDAQNDPKLFRVSINIEQMPLSETLKAIEATKAATPPPVLAPVIKSSPIQMEDTSSSANFNNETFVSVPTFQEPEPVKKTAAAAPIMDSTFNVNEEPNTVTSPASTQFHDSIMTEDLSIVDKKEVILLPQLQVIPGSATKNMAPSQHEIFNPFVQSPVKAKVDAFERHVKESKIPITPKYTHVSRLLTASSQPLPLRSQPQVGTPNQKAMTAFASDPSGTKLIHMKKMLAKSGLINGETTTRGSSAAPASVSSASSTASKSRSASVEDNKRHVNVLQQLAEEKKRKREEKQKLAQINREKLEKEKREQIEKLTKEREEKAKKFLQEKAEMAKMEKKKQAMARLAMENSQQQKMKELHKKLASENKSDGYNWNLLNSDDSTDDEGKVKKYPEAPQWSKDPLRGELIHTQSRIPPRLIDQMFGIKPMSPNLQEIFPDIDPKLLKRNSSMIWKTPPRASRVNFS